MSAKELAVLLGIEVEYLRTCLSRDRFNGAPQPVKKTRSRISLHRRKLRYYYDKDAIVAWWNS